MLKLVSGRVFALLAFTSLAACNTYNDSLLVGSLSPIIPAGGDGGTSGSGGEANGAAANADQGGDAGEGSDHGGGGSAGSGQAGAAPGAAAGSGGSAGNVAHAGDAGIGGSLGAAGGAGSAGMPAAGSGGAASTAQIDDFEDQDEFILRVGMRNGPWYVFSDATTTGTLGKLTIAPLTGADVRPSSTSTAALHLTASGFTDWGAGVGADMVNQLAKKAPYDVSAYRGVRFYAKIASGTAATIKVLLPNVFSDADGGKCIDTDTKKRCGDHLFKSVSGLKTTWDVYEVKFDEFTQQGFGLPQGLFDATGVYSVQFTLANKLPVDVWLDDVTFVSK
jgi:hypothetical protein